MKVTINGEAVVVTSALKLKDIKEIKKVKPNALVLKGGEDGKEEIFGIGIAKTGSGSLDANGATFSPTARGEEGLATITLSATGVTDIKSWIVENYSEALSYLRTLEEAIPAIVTEVAEAKAALMESITEIQ